MPSRPTVLVTGAGGFIGHHLVKYLRGEGYHVRGADLKLPEFEATEADEFAIVDLRNAGKCQEVARGVQEVYHLAADMGGIGYISGNHKLIARNNTLINVNMLDAAYDSGVRRFFFSSSACVYPMHRQRAADVAPLKEEDAVPAEPEEGYGWEKLFAEKLCQYYAEDGRLDTRVARFHNVYGPLGTYEGGREKAPAAICRKVALADDGGEIEVWGDGKQTRSFMYVEDCVEGIVRIMHSSHESPLNLGTDELTAIDALVDLVARVAGKAIRRRYDLGGPQGVRGRNSDNARLREVLGWEPATPLLRGMQITYAWIEAQVHRAGTAGDAPVAGAGRL